MICKANQLAGFCTTQAPTQGIPERTIIQYLEKKLLQKETVRITLYFPCQ